MIPESFHFLRPAWLLALAPLALVLWAAAHAAERATPWRRLVDAHLLRHLVVTGSDRARRWPLALGALAGVAACLALAGPAWERVPQPTFASVEPTVLVLDLSPAMNADDLSPSRLVRARHELQDILDRTRGGQVGLVLYTDEPFVASPLTDDARLVAEMLPSLETGLMPLRPARTDRALERAQALLDQAGAATGRVVLLSAGTDASAPATLAAARALAASGRTLAVLGTGTTDGAALRDARGRAIAPLDHDELTALASAGGGAFSELRADDTDLARILPARPSAGTHASQPGSSAQFDLWRDAGVWLVLIPLLLAPLAFRRGLIAALALALLAGAAGDAAASTWSDLWSRPDQRAQSALEAGDAAAAAALFEHPEWKAAAAYRSADYAKSVESYGALGGDENRYNLGNALAQTGKLEEAVAAYDQVLASLPEHADAKFNRDLVQRLLDEQRKQQEKQEQQKQPDQEQQQGQQGAQNEQTGESGQQGDADQGQQDASRDGDQQQGDAQAAADAQGADGQQDDAPGQADAQHAREAPEEGAEDGKASPENRTASATEPSPEKPGAEESAAARPEARNQAAEQDRTLAESLEQALAAEQDTERAAEQEADTQAAGASVAQRPLSEREQAREQALRNIPDDPGGLLRAKIRRQYAERRYSQQEVIPSW